MSLNAPATREEIAALYKSPVLDLIYRAATVHRAHHDPRQVQVCTLLSIKTGGCPENCSYCSQSAHFDTALERQDLLSLEAVRGGRRARRSRWQHALLHGRGLRQVRDGAEFDRVLDMVRTVAATGMEVCCTLGMLTADQARQLREAGLHAYNHNLGHRGKLLPRNRSPPAPIATASKPWATSAAPEFRSAGGGILGMGESEEDRIDLLCALLQLPTPPESIPVQRPSTHRRYAARGPRKDDCGGSSSA